MAIRNPRKGNSVFRKTETPLKPWEEQARKTARKTERLRALRLAREAAERDASAGGAGVAAPATGKTPPER